jgi:hypothetical protein
VGTTTDPPFVTDEQGQTDEDKPQGDEPRASNDDAPRRSKRPSMAERLAKQLEQISSGELDDDAESDRQVIEAMLSVGDSTMNIDPSELDDGDFAPPTTSPTRKSVAVPPPPVAPVMRVAIPTVTVPSKAESPSPLRLKVPPPVPRIASSPAMVRIAPPPMAPPTRTTATIPPPVRRRTPTSSQPAIVLPVEDISLSDATTSSAEEFNIDSAVEMLPFTDAASNVEPELASPPISLEAQLDSPNALEMAVLDQNEQGLEARAVLFEKHVEQLQKRGDNASAAAMAYELGHWYQHALEDEARAVKAYGSALALDPSLRANLWSIRSIFYRRGLWPNLLKLIDAELSYARDDHERADLCVEQAEVHLRAGAWSERTGAGKARASAPSAMTESVAAALASAKTALESALLYDAKHVGALLMLERLVSATCEPSNSDDLERLASIHAGLAELSSLPERQQASWLRVAELSAELDPRRAADAIEQAFALVDQCGNREAVAQRSIAVASWRRDSGATAALVAALEHYAAALEQRLSIGNIAEPVANLNPRELMLRREIASVYRRIAGLVRKDTYSADNESIDAGELAWGYLQRGLTALPGDALLTADLTDVAEELGKYQELAALVQATAAMEADPDKLLTLGLRRADALLRGGRHTEANDVIAQLRVSNDGSLAVASLLERLAIAGSDRQGLASAWRMMAEGFELGSWSTGIASPSRHPKAASAAYVAAAQAHDRGADEITHLLSKARELDPTSSSAWQATIDDIEASGDYRRAVQLLGFGSGDQVGQAPWSIEEKYRRATLIAVTHRDLELALEIEKKWAEQRPTDVDVRWRIDALAISLGGEHEQQRGPALLALAALEPSAELQGIALNEAARAFERAAWRTTGDQQLQHWQQAIAAYHEAAVRLPDEPSLASGLLAALRAVGDDVRIGELQQAQARRLPDGEAAHRAYREATLLATAPLDVAREWLGRFPAHVPAMVEVARLATAAKDWPSAASAWRSAHQAVPSSATAALLFADCSERSNAIDDALEGYSAVLESADAAVEVKALAALAAGDVVGSRDQAGQRTYATALLATAGSSRFAAELAEHVGWQWLAASEFEQADACFSQAEAIDPSRPGPLLGLSLGAASRNQVEQVACWQQKFAAQSPDAAVASALFVRAATAQFVAGNRVEAFALAQAGRARHSDDKLATEVAAQLMPRDADPTPLLTLVIRPDGCIGKWRKPMHAWMLDVFDKLRWLYSRCSKVTLTTRELSTPRFD